MKKAARSRLGLMYVFRHHGAISIIRKRWVNIVSSRENGTATYCAFPSSEAPTKTPVSTGWTTASAPSRPAALKAGRLGRGAGRQAPSHDRKADHGG